MEKEELIPVHLLAKGGFLARIHSGIHWVSPHRFAKTEWGHT
jgi:hypothetical protein